MANASRPQLLLPPILQPKYANTQPPSTSLSTFHYRSESLQTFISNEAYPINSNQCYYAAPQPPRKKRKIYMNHMHNHNIAPYVYHHHMPPPPRNITPHIHMHDDIIVDIVKNARKQKEKEDKMQSQQQPYPAPVCHYNNCNQCHVNNSYKSQETQITPRIANIPSSKRYYSPAVLRQYAEMGQNINCFK